MTDEVSTPEAHPPPANWPPQIEYLRQPVHSRNLASSQLEALKTKPESQSQSQSLSRISLPLSPPSHLTIIFIKNPSHPAHNQRGLFATTDLKPDSLVIPYLGHVHSNEESDTDASSDYDLSLDREAGISVDANRMGNEARMVNDYRGVPRPVSESASNTSHRVKVKGKGSEKPGPNAEFRDLWFEYADGSGEVGIGIFVLGAGKSGKRKGGIMRGEEVLVNYGKGFWRARLGVEVSTDEKQEVEVVE